MRADFWFDSCGAGKIHVCRWMPEGEPKAVFQIVHGIAEVAERYDAFAQVLAQRGFVVVADDHMGHGESVGEGDTKGYFTGGWFSAVADSYHLLEMTKAEYPNLPYVLFGHSMGSFMARTILCKYPDSGIDAAIICGTGWQPAFALPAVIKVVESVCKRVGETNPDETLHKLVFGGYNRKVEHPRTEFDWLTRDAKIVDAYIAHPMCGFTETTGLLRDLMTGIRHIEKPESLASMRKELPVFFVAGGDDPVGNYGKGVRQSADAFRKAGMTDVSLRIYPLCRHEILNEINREEVYGDILQWLSSRMKKSSPST